MSRTTKRPAESCKERASRNGEKRERDVEMEVASKELVVGKADEQQQLKRPLLLPGSPVESRPENNK